MKKKELQELIKQGEGYFVEFKKQVGESLDRKMVAFANASGDKIIVGVADDVVDRLLQKRTAKPPGWNLEGDSR